MTPDTPFHVLVVDDDKEMRKSLEALLQAGGWVTLTLSRADRVADELQKFPADVILSDVRMPGMSGLDLLKGLEGEAVPPMILISAHGDIPMAVEAMQSGAYSFLEKPYDPRRLLTALRHAAEQSRMRNSNARLRQRLLQLAGLDRTMLGQSPEILGLRQDILDLADSAASVLVQGPTGAGKELVVRALHDLSARADKPFLALNCAALSAETFEAEMFGTAGGAIGRFAAASGGTLFLDEICACPLPVQAKLLRVLEEQQVLPVGGGEEVPVQLRVLSATNQDVDEALRDGRLRQDFLFRLNTMVLTVPSLSQRRDDITLLAAHFLEDFSRIYESEVPPITQEDLAVLLSHDWPGNVRELRGTMERRVHLFRRNGGSMSDAMHAEQNLADVPSTLREAVAAFEREVIAKAIRQHQGRMEDTAEALGIGRRTLNEKIVKLGLDKDALL